MVHAHHLIKGAAGPVSKFTPPLSDGLDCFVIETLTGSTDRLIRSLAMSPFFRAKSIDASHSLAEGGLRHHSLLATARS